MTLTEILKNEDTSSSEKLAQLQAVVSAVRSVYGNTDLDIDVPEVNTPDGVVSLKYLDDDSKIALAAREVRILTIAAVEICESTQGAVFDKELESLIATNPTLANIAASTGSKYV